MVTRSIPCTAVVGGAASGRLLVLDEPLSLWGGVDPASGEIVDGHHPQAGRTVRGTVLAMSHGRGSSSASSVLAEMVRIGTAPSAFVLSRPDPIIVLGLLVAEELYAISVPLVVVDEDRWAVLETGKRAALTGAEGVIRVE